MFHFIVSFFIALSLSTYAKVTPEDLELLEEYKRELSPPKIKTQCVGDCYLISTVSLIEDMISKKLGKEVFISTIDLYQELLERRIQKRYVEDLFKDEFSPTLTYRQLGKVAIFDSGAADEVFSAATQGPLFIAPSPSPAAKYLIDENIRKYHEELNVKISEIDKRIRTGLRSLSHFHATRLKRKIEKHIILLEKTKEQSSIKNYKEHLARVESALEFNFALLNEKSHSLQDLSHILNLIREYATGLEFKNSESKELEKALAAIRKDQQQLFSSANSVERFLENKKEKIKEQLSKEILSFSKGLQSFHDSRPPNSTPIYFSNSEEYTEEVYTKEEIMDFLYENRFPALISYNHAASSFIGKNQSLGIQAGDDLPIYKGDRPELHQAYLIDSIKDENEEIRFLVVQNSWNKSFGYKGLNFIHVSHFSFIDEIEYIDFNDYEVSREKPCKTLMTSFKDLAKIKQ